jgi:hypothetical protein
LVPQPSLMNLAKRVPFPYKHKMPSANGRDFFRLFRTSDGQILVERPLRATRTQQDAAHLLAFDKDGGVSVQGALYLFTLVPAPWTQDFF